jgi:acyl-CoA synthetase (AMP-forming)/AMP-acid ligase II/acyl carrier protein
MGLIGKVLQPLWMGGSCAMMSPLDFLTSPRRWLAAISEYRATTSGAPNFAYDLCVRKIGGAQLEGIDLSSWRVAFCGAEPVRRATLERFADHFARSGFSRAAFLPCYGLAEASLIVSGRSRPDGFVSMQVDEQALRTEGIVRPATVDGRPLVGCGPVVGDQEIAIVKDGARCPSGTVGEIWVRGGSVGRGYLGKPEETEATFKARLSDGTGPFLRTGDLGALGADGELYVVGRVKDMLIVRGLNYYPHDIEATIESAWPGLRPGCSPVFAIEGENGDEIAAVTEYDARRAREGVAWDTVVDAIRSAVGTEHDLAIRTLVIVAAGQVPKTPSGKVQRAATRNMLSAGELDVLHRRDAPAATLEAEPVSDAPLRTKEEIVAFMTSWLSEALGQAVGPTAEWASIGLDSLDIVRMMETLAERLGRDVDPALALDYPSVDTLAARLADGAG